MDFDAFSELLVRVLRARRVRITPETTASDVPGWDSLRHVVLVMEINRVTGLDLTPEETMKVANVGALHGLITDALARRPASSIDASAPRDGSR